jgi:hypothetical protein
MPDRGVPFAGDLAGRGDLNRGEPGGDQPLRYSARVRAGKAIDVVASVGTPRRSEVVIRDDVADSSRRPDCRPA